MTFDDFITKWQGKPVDFDGIYPNECMDLMHQYIYDVLGLTDKSVLAAPAASQVYTTFPNVGGSQYFEQIANTPENVPEKGDIVFFGTDIGPFGHVCIFIDGDTNTFTSFDANWPTGSLPHVQQHSYAGCLGWLRLKAATKPMVAVDSDKFTELVGKSTKYDEFAAAGYISVDDVFTKVGIVTKENGELKQAQQTLNGKIQDLTSAIGKDATDDIATMGKLVDAEHQRDQESADLTKIAAALSVAYPSVDASLTAIQKLKQGIPVKAKKPQTFMEKLQFLFS